jgi:hypothetical protein
MYVVVLSHLAEALTPLVCIRKVPNSSLGWDKPYGDKIYVAILSHFRQISKNVP